MNSFEQLTDQEVINKVLQGEQSLYEMIVRRFNPYLYKIGRSYNLGHEDTRDLMQDTFVDAYKNLSQYEGRSTFKTWIIRIMMNNCYHKQQKYSFKNEKPQEVSDNAIPMFTHTNNDTEKAVQNNELKQVIEKALSDIPFNYRMVFSLREITGMSIAETAELLRISPANVKVRLNRAKAMLRTEIEKKYLPDELFEFNLIHCDAIVKNVMRRINEY